MKLALTIAGVLMMIAGVIWVGQGLGLVPGGFMYENPTWIYIGAATAIVGAGIIYFVRRRKM
jgi:LPXTG-motif cell wall-anchored protein